MKRNLLLVLCLAAFLGVVAGIDPFHVQPRVEEPARREEPLANKGLPEKEPPPEEARVSSRADIDDGEPASTQDEILAWRGRSRADELVAQDYFERLTHRLTVAVPLLEEFCVPDWREFCPEQKGARALAEMWRIAVERPADFDRSIVLLKVDPESSVGRMAARLRDERAEVRTCDALLGSLDALALPSVRGCRREGLFRAATPGFPASPWLRGRNVTAAWDLGGGNRGNAMLFDDGLVRRGLPGAWLVSFPTEIRRFLATTAAEAPSDDLLLQTILFARWAFQQSEFKPGLACVRRAREIGSRAWPRENDAQLGQRAARFSRDRLGGAPGASPRAGAPIPPTPPLFEIDFELHEALRDLECDVRWGELSQQALLALPREEQVEAALWKARWWCSAAVQESELTLWRRTIADGNRNPNEPAAWLRSLEWDAVPTLVEHLTDGTRTCTYHEDHLVCVADLCWQALQDFTGLPNSPDMSPESPWITTCVDYREQCSSIRAWWAEVANLPEVDRWDSLFRRGSKTAAKWLLSHAPERCFAEAWKRFDPATRRGLMERRSCEIAMRSAPREKLVALLESVEGDAREAVQRALEAQDAK